MSERAIDWGQYRLNGGSYCMAVMERDRYCGRAEAWPGHNHEAGWPNHPFVPGCPSPPKETTKPKPESTRHSYRCRKYGGLWRAYVKCTCGAEGKPAAQGERSDCG